MAYSAEVDALRNALRHVGGPELTRDQLEHLVAAVLHANFAPRVVMSIDEGQRVSPEALQAALSRAGRVLR